MGTMLQTTLYVTSLLVANVFAQTSILPSPSSITDNKYEPCDKIRRVLTHSDYVSAEDALACLRSVPLDVEGNIRLINDLKEWWQFASLLDYFRDPPSHATYRKVDVYKHLDEFTANLKTNKYGSEWEFHYDLYMMQISLYEYHFLWKADIMNVFWFMRGGPTSQQLSLASVSTDGKELPKVYEYSEFNSTQTNTSITNSNQVRWRIQVRTPL
jgi:hypothetical protein